MESCGDALCWLTLDSVNWLMPFALQSIVSLACTGPTLKQDDDEETTGSMLITSCRGGGDGHTNSPEYTHMCLGAA